jgi:DNA-binding transcriptional LysR family regulator
MAMELRHLRAFVAIADEGGVSAAARVLSITQPALSRTLVQLESALGIRLFDRSTTAVTLTAAGRDLLPKVVDALQAVDAIIDRRAPEPGHCASATPGRPSARSRRRCSGPGSRPIRTFRWCYVGSTIASPA